MMHNHTADTGSSEWVPSPGYLLRRHRIMHHISQFSSPLNLLEVGCGAGALLAEIQRLGHHCTALETSERARRNAAKLHSGDDAPAIFSEPAPEWAANFDVVAAFEVLEHIEDDREALRLWASWAKPTGRVIISVPADPKKWDASDEWAGHVRRYTRERLHDIFRAADLTITHFENYGFPLANVIAPIRAYAKSKAASEQSLAKRTANSGVERTAEGRLFRVIDNPLGQIAMNASCRVQGLFKSTDLGPGYLVLATKD